MDDVTGTKAYSYLRPRMQMPSPLLEHALFPNCPRFPELDRIQLPKSESRQNDADDSQEHFTTVEERAEPKRSTVVMPSAKTVRSSSNPTSVRSGLFTEKAERAPAPAVKSSSLPTRKSAETSAKIEEVTAGEGDAYTDRSPDETSPVSFDATAPFDELENDSASEAWKEINAQPVNTKAILVTAVSVLVVSFLIIMGVLLVPNTSSHRRRVEDDGDILSPGNAGRRRRSGADVSEVPSSATSLSEPRATRKRSFDLAGKGDSNAPPGGQETPLECDTEACRWESRLVNEKLNVSVDPCVDFYAYVCSKAWDLNNDLPYRAAGKAFLINEVTRYLREHAHSLPAAAAANRVQGQHNFLDHSSLVLNGCLKNAVVKAVSQWDGIRGVLRDVGLEDWPYIEPPRQHFQLDSVLKLIDRQMAIFPIVRVFLRRLSDNGSYVLHLDAPSNILFVQYTIQKTDESLPYKEIIRQTLTLWKTLPRSGTMVEDVMNFEAQLLNASKPVFKPFWKKPVVYSLEASLRLPMFRVDSYLSYLRQHDANEVVVLNEAYISSLLPTILRELIPQTVLNFLGVHVIAHMAPLLPQDSIPRDLMRMGYPSFQHHVEARTQSCFHLVSRLFPHGMRWVLRDILAKTSDLDRQWDLTTKNMVSSLARTFRQGAAWTRSVDVSSAIRRLKTLQVGYLAGQEREEDIDQYYAPMNVTYGPGSLVRYYGKLLAGTLNRYWESSSDGAGYDARHDQRSTDLDVMWTRSPESTSGIYLTSSSVASAALVARANYPSTLFSLLAADMTRALFLSSLDDAQWSSWKQDRFRELQYCLLKRYEQGINKLRVSAANVRYFLADILADNAVIKPLTVAFRRFSHAPLSQLGQRSSNITAWRLFFVNYAAGFCVPKSEEAQMKERMRYRLSLPPSVRVNLALRDLERFRKVFKCPRDTPVSLCPVWKSEDDDPAESG